MKWMLCVCLTWAVMVAAIAEPAEPDSTVCPTLSEEKMAELKTLVVTEDVHDQLVGDFTEVWGQKSMLDKDEKTCIKSSRQKVDDKELSQSIYLKGEMFGGEKNKTGSLTKIENGIYALKKHTGEAKGKLYILYAKNHVYAFFACKTCKGHDHGSSDETKKPEEKKDGEMKKGKVPFWSTVSIRAEDLKTPRDEEVQKAVKEAVEKIQAHKELLGEISEFPNPC